MFTNDTLPVRILKITGMVTAGIIFAVLMALIFGYVFMRLWNWLMPEIFSLGAITFWQGFGLLILAKIIFSGFGKHSFHNKKDKRKSDYNHLKFDKMADFMAFTKWGRDKSKHFHEYWQKEGKEAFEEYMRKREYGEDRHSGE